MKFTYFSQPCSNIQPVDTLHGPCFTYNPDGSLGNVKGVGRGNRVSFVLDVGNREGREKRFTEEDTETVAVRVRVVGGW